MDLSNEDSLRLNVLMTQGLHAIRIDESSMTVHALTNRGEAKVALNPNCREENYLRKVKELLSMHALGSPGGYPVYLKRWTRMGQMKEESLKGLLLLGEPEAIIAVAHSPGLNEEVGRYAWWAMPSPDVGRQMLMNKNIIGTSLGREIAAFLVDYLPFETEAGDLVKTVSLVLQPGLIEDATVQSLWSRASRKSAFYVGFLLATPEQIPDQKETHQQLSLLASSLQSLVESNNPLAKYMLFLLQAEGQTFLKTLSLAIPRLSDQDVVVLYLQAIERFFMPIRNHETEALRYVEKIVESVERLMQDSGNPELQSLINQIPDQVDKIRAMLVMGAVSESLINPIFSQTDAVGSVMRKKIAPVTDCISEQIGILLN